MASRALSELFLLITPLGLSKITKISVKTLLKYEKEGIPLHHIEAIKFIGDRFDLPNDLNLYNSNICYKE